MGLSVAPGARMTSCFQGRPSGLCRR
jgi:hypothetical protein